MSDLTAKVKSLRYAREPKYTRYSNEIIIEIEKLQALPKYHHPDCNYWKWDWRYSWDVTDCNCETVAGPSAPLEEDENVKD